MARLTVSIALGVLGLAAFCSAGAAQAADFGTRAPRVCDPVTSVPSVDQAVALVQCHTENQGSRDLILLEKVKVQIGAPRSYMGDTDSGLPDIDPATPVYPIRGSFVRYHCDPVTPDDQGTSCFTVDQPAASGACWQTSFGNWDCLMADNNHVDLVAHQPPP